MKTIEKNQDEAMQKEGIEQPQKKGDKELRTDNPMSEKDEVKQAEQNTNTQQNKSR